MGTNVSDRGPLEVLESRLRNWMIDQADLKDRLERAKSGTAAAQRTLLLELVKVRDAAEAYRVDAPAAGGDGHLGDLCILIGKTLAAQGVQEIPGVGQAADGRWHRVVESVPDPHAAAGTILREFRKAYLWKDAVLREGEVVVSAGPAVEETGTPARSD